MEGMGRNYDKPLSKKQETKGLCVLPEVQILDLKDQSQEFGEAETDIKSGNGKTSQSSIVLDFLRNQLAEVVYLIRLIIRISRVRLEISVEKKEDEGKYPQTWAEECLRETTAGEGNDDGFF